MLLINAINQMYQLSKKIYGLNQLPFHFSFAVFDLIGWKLCNIPLASPLPSLQTCRMTCQRSRTICSTSAEKWKRYDIITTQQNLSEGYLKLHTAQR